MMNNLLNVAKIKIDKTLCNKCGDCELSCPWHIFQFQDNNSIPQLVNTDLCVSCGHCITVCPNDAIIHTDFKNGDIINVNQQLIPSYHQILELLRSRRSIRAFEDRQVEKDVIRKIIEGACFAPSTNNIQSTEYTVVQKKDVIKKIKDITAKFLMKNISLYQNPLVRIISSIHSPKKTMILKNLVRDYKVVLSSINKQNDLIIHNAPVLLFFNADKNIGFTDVNASLALQNATLAIHSLGLGCFYAGYVAVTCKNNDEIKKIINIPKNHEIYGCLAIGYPRLKYERWIVRKKPKIDWI